MNTSLPSSQTLAPSSSALVLFSGGQDSTTCLAWALERYEHVETLGFQYGQRHAIELTVRPHLLAEITKIKSEWQHRLKEDHVIDLSLISQLSQTALTHNIAIAMQENGLPNTFVPGRNLFFLIVAATLAYRRGLHFLVAGMCETDYSGYPDCRNESLQAFEHALNLGMASQFKLETPLMYLSKAATWDLAFSLGGNALVNLIKQHTHTCYLGERGQLHDWGYGCGTCPACELRAKGYAAFINPPV